MDGHSPSAGGPASLLGKGGNERLTQLAPCGKTANTLRPDKTPSVLGLLANKQTLKNYKN